MNGLPYYKRYPRDFIEGTIGLSFEIKAAYGLILDLIYMQGGKLPDDARYISGLLGCSIRKWKSLRSTLIEIGKVQVSGEFLTNYRAVSELESLAKLQHKQSENRSKPNKINGFKSPKCDHTEPEPEPEDLLEENKSTHCVFSDEFEQWWKDEYPERDGTHSKAKAKVSYIRYRKKGVTKEMIWEATLNYFNELVEQERISTRFVKQATTFLNDQPWEQ